MENYNNIAWAAGILEGEGCFSRHIRKKNSKVEYAIHCEMTDEEPVTELQKIFGVGTICYRENNRKDGSIRKPSWIWSVQTKQAIIFVLNSILPFIRSARRLEKINNIKTEINNAGIY